MPDWFDGYLFHAGVALVVMYYVLGWSVGLVFDLIRKS